MEVFVKFMILLQSILVLFAIVNPIGSIPLFLQLTSSMDKTQKDKTFKTAIFTSAAILFIFAVLGQEILTRIFQVSVADLSAAGGLLLMLIAADHLVFGQMVRSVLKIEGQDAPHIGAVPMACPILAGPGAMMTVLIIDAGCGFLIAALSIIIVLGGTWLIFRFMDRIYSFIGKAACLVLSKILSLFLAAIGFHMLMMGIVEYYK